MKKELVTRLHRSFEGAVHHEGGAEFWLARELQDLLGYQEWRNFSAGRGQGPDRLSNRWPVRG